MPRLEAYYHDGNSSSSENDAPHSTRKDVKDATNLVQKIRMGTGEQIKEQRQIQWMNADNPHLWDGDFD